MNIEKKTDQDSIVKQMFSWCKNLSFYPTPKKRKRYENYDCFICIVNKGKGFLWFYVWGSGFQRNLKLAFFLNNHSALFKIFMLS